MIKKIALIVSICMMVAMVAYSEQEPETAPDWVDFAHGKYLLGTGATQENVMAIIPNKPMTTDRYAIYGNVIEDPKTRSRSVNKKDKNKITPEGLSFYEYLINLKSDDGWYKFNAVAIEYNKITIVKDYRFEWGGLLDDIVKAFK